MSLDLVTFRTNLNERIARTTGQVQAYRDRVVEYATDGRNSTTINTVLSQMATHEGSLYVYTTYLDIVDRALTMLETETDYREVAMYLLRSLNMLSSRTPDDTWSGRGNDHARALADGRREAADEISFELNYAITEAGKKG